jgi:hypothetical protein
VDGEDVERANVDANAAALFGDSPLLVDHDGSAFRLMNDRHASGLLFSIGIAERPALFVADAQDA